MIRTILKNHNVTRNLHNTVSIRDVNKTAELRNVHEIKKKNVSRKMLNNGPKIRSANTEGRNSKDSAEIRGFGQSICIHVL